jgi:hypothetical protein
MISNETVIKQYFEVLSWSVARVGIENKPCQIIVTKLAGLEKKKSRQKVSGLKCKNTYRESLFAPGHINGHLCICAHGEILPSIIIFKKSLPHTAYCVGVPGGWLYGFSESGYMKSVL